MLQVIAIKAPTFIKGKQIFVSFEKNNEEASCGEITVGRCNGLSLCLYIIVRLDKRNFLCSHYI